MSDVGPVTQDSDVHSPTAWRRDLIAAGWEQVSHTVWRAPDGALWRGPYRAWCELQRRQGWAATNESTT